MKLGKILEYKIEKYLLTQEGILGGAGEVAKEVVKTPLRVIATPFKMAGHAAMAGARGVKSGAQMLTGNTQGAADTLTKATKSLSNVGKAAINPIVKPVKNIVGGLAR